MNIDNKVEINNKMIDKEISIKDPYGNKDVIKKIVQMEITDDIKDKILWKTRWIRIADTLETMSKILAGSCTILSFATTYSQNNMYAFIGGCIGTTGIVLNQFSNYAKKEAKEKTNMLNTNLQFMSLPAIPSFVATNNNDDP